MAVENVQDTAIFTGADGKPKEAIGVAIVRGGGGAGGGAGTEYTEDAAAPANPAGGALIARRRDALTAGEVSADGDMIALNATGKGELVTRDADAIAELQAIKGYVDAVEAKLDAVIAAVDGLETLVGSTNAKLDAANTSLDNIEAAAQDSTTPSPVVSGDPGAALAVQMNQTLSAQANAATALIDLADKRIVGLRVDAWTAAQLTIQVSPDNNAANAADLYVLNLDGSLAQAKVNSADMAAGKAIALDPAVMATARYVRFVSGPSANPVAQVAARTITARLMVR